MCTRAEPEQPRGLRSIGKSTEAKLKALPVGCVVQINKNAPKYKVEDDGRLVAVGGGQEFESIKTWALAEGPAPGNNWDAFYINAMTHKTWIKQRLSAAAAPAAGEEITTE